MKYETVIKPDADEKVLIFAKEKTSLVSQIEALCEQDGFNLVGFIEREGVSLDLGEIEAFISEDKKLFAVVGRERYSLKFKLYQLEEKLPDNFVKINKSCIANLKKIKRFDGSISGTLIVKFSGGHEDYVSRRQLKNIKERLGI